MGSSARWPSPRFTRYHAQPNMRTASATRSVTESKKAPRTDAVPAALATGPSKRSCMPVTINMTMAQCSWPAATRMAVTVADTRPVAVRTSAVIPWRCNVSPTGPVVRSTAVRQRPSNIELLWCAAAGETRPVVCKSLPFGHRIDRWVGGAESPGRAASAVKSRACVRVGAGDAASGSVALREAGRGTAAGVREVMEPVSEPRSAGKPRVLATALPEASLDVTIVAPSYNPGPRLRMTVEHMVRVLDASGMTFEIITVSDGSTDGSHFTLEGFPGSVVRQAVFDRNTGKGHALRAGLGMGRGRYLGFIDADGDLSPEFLAPFVSILHT